MASKIDVPWRKYLVPGLQRSGRSQTGLFPAGWLSEVTRQDRGEMLQPFPARGITASKFSGATEPGRRAGGAPEQGAESKGTFSSHSRNGGTAQRPAPVRVRLLGLPSVSEQRGVGTGGLQTRACKFPGRQSGALSLVPQGAGRLETEPGPCGAKAPGKEENPCETRCFPDAVAVPLEEERRGGGVGGKECL